VSKRKQSRSARIFWLLSLFLVGSMVISLFIVAIPERPVSTPTPWPTWPPAPSPTATPTSLTPEPSPTLEATEPPIGPVLPTNTFTTTPTPAIRPSPTLQATEVPMGPVLPTDTPTVTPTLSATPASAGLAFQFAVCGDSRDNPTVYRRLLAAVAADGSEFLINTGDLVNTGTEAQWQAFRETMAGFALPFYPVPGNHDGLVGKLDGYLKYSGAPAAHYSFDRGSVHFALADSHNGGVNAEELAWLRNDLSGTSQPLKMVFVHHPPFDPDGTDHIMAYGNQEFMALMVGQGVDYVFAGHIHAYSQEKRDGVTYFISGGGGAPLYSADHPQAFYHYLRVAVRGEEVTIEVVKI
jgi:predicted phosphodiesterase